MICEKCKGKKKFAGNHRTVNVRTLQGIKPVHISQLRCTKCNHYSSSVNELAPKNMSIGYDVIDFVLLERKKLTREQVKRKLMYKYSISLSIGTIQRIDNRFGKK